MVEIEDRHVSKEDALRIYEAYKRYICRECDERERDTLKTMNCEEDFDEKFCKRLHGLCAVRLNIHDIETEESFCHSLGTFSAGLYINGLCTLYLLDSSLVFKVTFKDANELIEMLDNAMYHDFYDQFTAKFAEILKEHNNKQTSDINGGLTDAQQENSETGSDT